MDRLRPTRLRFTPRDPPDAAAFVAESVTTAPYRFHARVLVAAPAPAVAERVPPSTGVVEAVDERGLEAGGCTLEEARARLDAGAEHAQ